MKSLNGSIIEYWNTIVYLLTIISLIVRLWWRKKQPVNYYAVDLETPLLIIGGIVFTLIWGGIFWW